MRLIEWLKGLHFHKWELVRIVDKNTFYKCIKCDTYKYIEDSKEYICKESEYLYQINCEKYWKGVQDTIDKNRKEVKEFNDWKDKLKSESKRRCRG